jgi:hypothetical protein
MPRTLFLASLASHIVVEVGDIIHPPGAGYSGRVARIDLRRNSVVLECPPDAPQGDLSTSLLGCGLVWMDESYIRPRPEGEVDHGKALGC